MGWLYMKSLKGYSGPRQYLDAQFTNHDSTATSKVLRSALVRMRVYYAAVERVSAPTGLQEVWGAICLVRYNPRDRQGYIFGYKDMSESRGPFESDCPELILDLLTPTDSGDAQEWRARCRAHAATNRAKAAKPSPRPGQRNSLRRSPSIHRRPKFCDSGCRYESTLPPHGFVPCAGLRRPLSDLQRQ